MIVIELVNKTEVSQLIPMIKKRLFRAVDQSIEQTTYAGRLSAKLNAPHSENRILEGITSVHGKSWGRVISAVEGDYHLWVNKEPGHEVLELRYRGDKGLKGFKTPQDVVYGMTGARSISNRAIHWTATPIARRIGYMNVAADYMEKEYPKSFIRKFIQNMQDIGVNAT